MASQPREPNTVTLTIDGHEVTVPEGTTILKAAATVGVEIPTFCYHDGLSIAANCRMCLVESDKSPKLLPACHAEVSAGAAILTDSARVREARRAVLEFILVNHPVDCPICDQAGECELQDHYQDHDLQASRLSIRKLHKPKAKKLGPYVMYDGERCITCTRCVRFTREVTGTDELAVGRRGDRAEITTFPGNALENPYSMCVADLCPVGALTTTPFRFRARVWWLSSTDSVCNLCARGCNIRVDTYRDEVQRYVPRENAAVNRWWMCDEGRLAASRAREDRLRRARVIDDRGSREVSTRSAAETAIARLREARAVRARLGFVLSPNATNENLWAAARFAQESLRLERVYLGGRAPLGSGNGEAGGDGLLRRDDSNANRFGAERVAAALGLELAPLSELCRDLREGALEGLVFQGSEHALDEQALGALDALDTVVVVAAFTSPLTGGAGVALPAAPFYGQTGSLTNYEGRVQCLRAAVSPEAGVHPDWKLFARLARGLDGGAGFGWRDVAEVFAELADRVPHFAGLSLDDLGAGGALPAPASPDVAVSGPDSASIAEEG